MPAFNEEATIAAVIDEVYRTNPEVDILVVNDGSRDATVAEVRRTPAAVISLPFNLGVGGAMRAGFRFARHYDYDAVIQLDSDGQHDPAYIPVLLQTLDDGNDIVIGARFAGQGDYTVRGPRKWAMGVLAFVLSRVCGTRLTDTTSGYKAMNRRALALFARDYPTEYLGDTIEALVNASRAHLRVIQVPVAMRERAGGTPSQNPVRSTLYLVRAGLALLIGLMRPRSPQDVSTS